MGIMLNVHSIEPIVVEEFFSSHKFPRKNFSQQFLHRSLALLSFANYKFHR